MNTEIPTVKPSTAGKTKLALVLVALVVLVGGAYWSYKAGVWDKYTETAQDRGISYKGEQGKTALTILKEKYKVETQTFSGGEFVKVIDGVAPDQNHYWSFIVNGQEMPIGADQYVTKDGDTVEWKLKQVNTSL